MTRTRAPQTTSQATPSTAPQTYQNSSNSTSRQDGMERQNGPITFQIRHFVEHLLCATEHARPTAIPNNPHRETFPGDVRVLLLLFQDLLYPLEDSEPSRGRHPADSVLQVVRGRGLPELLDDALEAALPQRWPEKNFDSSCTRKSRHRSTVLPVELLSSQPRGIVNEKWSTTVLLRASRSG